MRMKETGQFCPKNLLETLTDEFRLPLPLKNKVEIERTIYKNNKWLEIIESQVKKYPNSNKTSSYLRVKRPSFSQVILLNESKDILVQLRYRNGSKDYVIEFPGGAIEKNETPKDAAKRELKEELNIKNINLKELGECYMDPMRSDFKGYFFKGYPQIEIKPFTSFVNGELEESLFIWMNKNQIRRYFRYSPLVQLLSSLIEFFEY